MNKQKHDITLVEVAPRDGLQNEKTIVSTQHKIDFINLLSKTGLRHIEVTSFVSPKAMPQLADNHDVLAVITRTPDIVYSALVPNLQGYQQVQSLRPSMISVFTAASNTFCQKNIRCTIEESLQRFQPVFTQAKQDNIPVRAYISCVFACPYEGKIAPQQVVGLVERLLDMGAEEISLGDTTGVGTLQQVQQLLVPLNHLLTKHRFAVHFHNTYGQALPNIVAAIEQGIKIIDTSVAGLGGCPYARGATGNVPTEDVIYCLEGMGLKTGVDLDALLVAGEFICEILKKPPASFVARARQHR